MQDLGSLRARLLLEAENFKKGMQQARDEMSKTGFSARQASQDMELIQKASLAIGTAVVAGIGASVKVAADFEAQMSRVKAISGATDEEFEKLKASALELGASTSKSASEVALGFEDMAAMGFEVNEIISAMPGVIAAAEASGTDLATTSGIVAAALNSFQMEAAEATKVADVLAMTANVSAANVQDMGYAFKYAAPVANTLGISMEELAAATGIMVDSGLEGSQAGTTLRMALLRLADPTKEGAEALADLGVKATDSKGNFLDFSEIIPQFVKGLDGMTDAQKAASLSTIFGSEAVSGMLAVIDGGPTKFNEFTKSLENSSGASQEAAAIMKDNLKGAFDEFKGSVESLGIEVGDELLPLFTDVVKHGTDVVRTISEIDASTIMAGLAFAGTAASIGLAITSINKLVIATRALMLSMGPAGWLITGISVLGGLMAAGAATTEDLQSSVERLNTELESANGLEKSIKEFDDLKTKSELTTEEFARFIDINSEMSKTTDTQAIERLKDEQDNLREKSGLSNEELKRMVDLNSELTEKVPGATEKISEQGQAIIENTDALKDYSKEKLASLYAELDLKRLETEVKYKDTLQEEKDLIKERKRLQEELITLQETQSSQQNYLTEQKKILNEMDSNRNKYSDYEIQNQQEIVNNAEEDLRLAEKRVGEQAAKIIGQKEELENVQKEIKGYETIRDQMVSIELRQAGINAKKGEEVAEINKAIAKLEEEKRKLAEKVPVNQRNTQEYKNSVNEINKQISALENTKSKVIEITGQAERMNAELGRDVFKNVVIETRNRQIIERGSEQATGPREIRHSGGSLPKLHIGGVPDWLSNLPNHNEVDVRLLRNEMVLTETQQANLFRLLDSGFSLENRGSSENNTGVTKDELKEFQKMVTAALGRPATIEMDKREVARLISEEVNNFQKLAEESKDREVGRWT